MLPGLIASLATSGLSSLGESLFDTLVDKGADAAEGIIKDVTGLDIDLNKEPTQSELEALRSHGASLEDALNATREANRHEEAMGTLALQKAEVDYKDTADARKIGTTLMATKDKTDVLRYYIPLLSTVIIVGSMWISYHLVSGNFPDGNRDLVNIFLGALITSTMSTIHYWFGTGHSSAKKDATISRASAAPDMY